jgi:hypothetical protein
MICRTVGEALEAAEQAEEQDLRGLYPSAVRVLARELMTLYRSVELDEDGGTETPVQYVGVYVLNWGKRAEPQVAFSSVEREDYPKTPGFRRGQMGES